MDAVEKVARELRIAQPVPPFESWETAHPIYQQVTRDIAARLIAAFPQLALEGREEWEYAQAIPSYGFDDEQNGWHVDKSFHGDPNRALDEGFTLVRRALGPWSEVQS